MPVYFDFFSTHIMANIQVLVGFHFYIKLLQKNTRTYVYILIASLWLGITYLIPAGGMAEFVIYILLLTASGMFLCHADSKSALLYAALTVEVMQLCYGIVNSLLLMLYPFTADLNQKAVGIAFMILGHVALLPAVLCYRIICRSFSYYETIYKTIQKQSLFMVLTPILLIFFMSDYISSVIYGNTSVTDSSGRIVHTNHYQIFVIQLLGMASLFCIMSAYKKLLRNLRLSTELTLLKQEEHSLNQYVEEAKARYEKTKSFRHDIKNHITVLKELLQNEKPKQALDYIKDMADITEELSFPCSTNNPVADILIGNKLGLAKSMGIDVCCTLHLPYPCFIRDIDFCIILSNALDNAVHACKKIKDSTSKYIHVTGRIQGDFLLLEIENSVRGNTLFQEGTGLSNIKAVAEKYHGAMSTKTQGTTFLLSVLLIIPQHSEDISRQTGSGTDFDRRKI